MQRERGFSMKDGKTPKQYFYRASWEMKSDDEYVEDAEYLTVVMGEDNKSIEIISDDETGLNITLNEVLEIARNAGYTKGVLIVIAESALSGTVYKYGNHGSVWERCGETIGYA